MERTRPDLNHPCGGKAKGFTVTNILDLVSRQHGPQVVTDFARTLPDALRSPIETRLLLPAAWVPIELYFAVVQYLVERFHGGDVRAALDIGKASAEVNIGTFFKAVLSFTSPAMVIGMSGRFWKSYYDVGELKVVANEKGRVVGELSQWPFDDPLTVNELGGSFLAYLEKSRASEVKLVEAGPVSKGTLRFDLSYR